MFQKFRFYERYRQVRTVDGNILAQFQQVGHRSDVILVSVGQHHAHHVVHSVLNIGEIRQNQVHPGLNLFGKQHPAIHNQDFAFGFQNGHVAADFAQAAQGHHSQDIGLGRAGLWQLKNIFTHPPILAVCPSPGLTHPPGNARRRNESSARPL